MSFIYIYLKKNIYNIFSIFFLILSCNYLFQDLSFYASIQILFSFLISFFLQYFYKGTSLSANNLLSYIKNFLFLSLIIFILSLVFTYLDLGY